MTCQCESIHCDHGESACSRPIDGTLQTTYGKFRMCGACANMTPLEFLPNKPATANWVPMSVEPRSRGGKVYNEYAAAFGRNYARIPKAVFAAVAMSYCSAGGDNLEDGPTRFMQEWQTLFDNGIVPQKPHKPAVPR